MEIILTLHADSLEDLADQASQLYTETSKADVAEWNLKTLRKDNENLTYQLEQITDSKSPEDT